MRCKSKPLQIYKGQGGLLTKDRLGSFFLANVQYRFPGIKVNGGAISNKESSEGETNKKTLIKMWYCYSKPLGFCHHTTQAVAFWLPVFDICSVDLEHAETNKTELKASCIEEQSLEKQH